MQEQVAPNCYGASDCHESFAIATCTLFASFGSHRVPPTS